MAQRCLPISRKQREILANRPGAIALSRAATPCKALTDRVARLRCELDPVTGARAATSLGGAASVAGDFGLALAHELYRALFGEVEDLIVGKHLLIVPSGPLTSLPFQVLVTVSRGRVSPPTSKRTAWPSGQSAATC
jgi:hypothetical protein